MPVILPGFASFLLPLALLIVPPDGVPRSLAIASAVAGIVGLGVTVALETPRPRRLGRGGKEDAVIAELIHFKGPRKASITASGILTLVMVLHAFAPAGRAYLDGPSRTVVVFPASRTCG